MEWDTANLSAAGWDQTAPPPDDYNDDFANFLLEQQQILSPANTANLVPLPDRHDGGKTSFWTQFLPYSFRNVSSTSGRGNSDIAPPQIYLPPGPASVPSLTFTSINQENGLDSVPQVSQESLAHGNQSGPSQFDSAFSFRLGEDDELDDLMSLDDRASLISRYSTGRSSLRSQGRKLPRFSRHQTEILQRWLKENKEYPYPSQGELRTLAQVTGLRTQQIRNWFSRTRVRKLAPSLRSISTTSSVSMSLIPHQPISDDEDGESMSGLDMSKLAKWSQRACDGDSVRATSPAQLPLIYTVFDDLLLSETPQSRACGSLAHWPASNIDWWLNTLPADASSFVNASICPLQDQTIDGQVNHDVGAAENARSMLYSEQLSAATSSSYPVNVLASSTMSALTAARKGRRRFGPSAAVQALSSDLDQIMFEDVEDSQSKFVCSYCGASFGRKTSCKRHEESKHAPKEVFICQPLNSNGNGGCPFCPQRDSPCQHDFTSCVMRKDEADRTFFRRDGFAQHLKNVHKVDAGLLCRSANVDLWRKSCEERPANTVSAADLLKSIITK